jgi:hypothetical protein
MLVMKGDGQWFGSDVRRVVFDSDPLELGSSASDLLLDFKPTSQQNLVY